MIDMKKFKTIMKYCFWTFITFYCFYNIFAYINNKNKGSTTKTENINFNIEELKTKNYLTSLNTISYQKKELEAVFFVYWNNCYDCLNTVYDFTEDIFENEEYKNIFALHLVFVSNDTLFVKRLCKILNPNIPAYLIRKDILEEILHFQFPRNSILITKENNVILKTDLNLKKYQIEAELKKIIAER